jgi:hypothetical protein
LSERQRLERFFREEVDHYLQRVRYEGDEEACLKSIAHTMLWACALDEHHAKTNETAYLHWREAQPSCGTLLGIRCARHRALHQAANFLRTVGGMCFPIEFPAPVFEITWVTELPPADKRHSNRKSHIAECEAYRQHLAGKPVRFAMHDLRKMLLSAP